MRKILVLCLGMVGCSTSAQQSVSPFVEATGERSIYGPPAIPPPAQAKLMHVQPTWTVKQSDPEPVARRSSINDGMLITFYEQAFPTQGVSAWTVVAIKGDIIQAVQRFAHKYVPGF